MEAKDFRRKSNLGWAGLKILTIIEIKAFWRNKNILYSQIMQPIMYFLFLVMGVGGTIGNITYNNLEVSYEMYALVGIMGLLITSQMTQTIYRTTIDKRWGLLPLKFSSGIKPFYYIIGMSTYPTLGFLFQSTILYLLSLIMGLNFNISNYLTGLILAVIALLFWTSLGTLITVFINDYQKRDSILAMLILPLGFTAPTFYLIDTVPNYIKIVTHFNPLTYQITAIRSIMFDEPNLPFIALTVSLTILSFATCSVVLHKAKLVIKEK